MGGQIDIRADAAVAGMGGAVVGRRLATLIRRLGAGYNGQRPAGLVVGCICVCAGGLPQAGARAGLVPATETMIGVRLDRRLLAGAGIAWAAAGSGPGSRRVCAGQLSDSGYAPAPLPYRVAAGPGRWRLAKCRPGTGARMTALTERMTALTDEPGSVPPAVQGPGGTHAADAAGRLGIPVPDVPRLELDQLLMELVGRAAPPAEGIGR
jgi:hypothetical protein